MYLIWLYLFFMFPPLVAYLGFIIFAFAVAWNGHRHSVLGMAFEEYKFPGFSQWLQDRVRSIGNWDKIRAFV
jgi:hypothetical protein